VIRRLSFRLDSIRQRLRIGFGVLIVLLLVGGIFGYSALSNMSSVIRGALADVQEEGLLSARLSASVMRELSAAAADQQSRDSVARGEFQRLSWETHRVQREMNKRPGHIAQEVTLIASIDAKLSEIEIRYATAHRLADLGRDAAAREVGERARVVVTSLLFDVENVRVCSFLRSRSPSCSPSSSSSTQYGRSPRRSRISSRMRAN
jgi:hypothetical protein